MPFRSGDSAIDTVFLYVKINERSALFKALRRKSVPYHGKPIPFCLQLPSTHGLCCPFPSRLFCLTHLSWVSPIFSLTMHSANNTGHPCTMTGLIGRHQPVETTAVLTMSTTRTRRTWEGCRAWCIEISSWPPFERLERVASIHSPPQSHWHSMSVSGHRVGIRLFKQGL